MSKTNFESLIKIQENFQTSIARVDSDNKSVKENFKNQQNLVDLQANELKQINKQLSNFNSIQLPSINENLSKMVTKLELQQLKKEHEKEVKKKRKRKNQILFFNLTLPFSIWCQFIFRIMN